MIQGALEYNESNDRYGIIDLMDLWANEGLHCGAGRFFDVVIGGSPCYKGNLRNSA